MRSPLFGSARREDAVPLTFTIGVIDASGSRIAVLDSPPVRREAQTLIDTSAVRVADNAARPRIHDRSRYRQSNDAPQQKEAVPTCLTDANGSNLSRRSAPLGKRSGHPHHRGHRRRLPTCGRARGDSPADACSSYAPAAKADRIMAGPPGHPSNRRERAPETALCVSSTFMRDCS